ncbi:MAG: helix-turn-helix transcriptional regulator [Lewinellaceae bacterium]|nr:helix-turn-helix transcriptional regulator [Saprospiraceae bacterium]MCB9316575.1 helix-turn-helix transcriptional regulator [Lewinellaceae bacterium]MCB9331535.1 helix-turn-helix transcriptional regulator [Lewinellaceae bacterium]
MQSWLFIPAPPLDLYIEHFFLYQNLVSGHARERMLPDGHIELVIDLREQSNFWYKHDDPTTAHNVQRGWISGVHRNYITLEAAQGASMLVVRFRPGRILQILGMPAQEIAGQVVLLDELWGPAFEDLRNGLLERPTAPEKFAWLEQFFFRKIQYAGGGNPVIDFAIDRLQTLSTAAGIAAIVEKTGYSHKHFVSLFHQHLGVPPKVFSRILKFQHAVRQLESTFGAPDWSALSYSCGYYDQAHFINEFKSFSGFSPSFYLEKRGKYLNYLPVD